jgi:hypothetical protein
MKRETFKNVVGLALAVVIPAFILIGYTQYKGFSVAADDVLPGAASVVETATSSESTQTITPISQQPSQSSAPVRNAASTTNGAPTSNHVQSNSPQGWYYVFASPDNYHKNPGSTIIFTGSHFYPYEVVTITQDGVRIGSVQANAAGAISTGSFTVPYVSGKVNYIFTGNVSAIPFTVGVNVNNEKSWITLSSYYAGAGAPITVMGHSFGSNEQVTLWFGGMNVGTVTTDMNGDFSLNMVVPQSNTGQLTVQAVGVRTNSSATQSFSQAF